MLGSNCINWKVWHSTLHGCLLDLNFTSILSYPIAILIIQWGPLDTFVAPEWSCSIIRFVHPEGILLSCSADSSQKKFSMHQEIWNTPSQITLNLHLAERQFASLCKISAFVQPKGSISTDCNSRSVCKYVCTWIHMHDSIKDSASLSWRDD